MARVLVINKGLLLPQFYALNAKAHIATHCLKTVTLHWLHLLLGHKSVLNERFKPSFLNLKIKIFQKLKPRGLVSK